MRTRPRPGAFRLGLLGRSLLGRGLLGRGLLGRGLLGLGLAAFLVSCGGEAPELLALEWRLELRPRETGSYESLSLFSAVRDPDGIEDLEALWILCDERELYWSLDPASWTRRVEGAETWIGAADLVLPDRGKLPRGRYRVVLADLAGRRVEREFRLEEPGALPPLPRLAQTGAYLSLESSWPETLLLAFDGTGALVKAVQAKPGRGNTATLLGSQDADRSAALGLYGYDPAKKTGGYSWRTKVK